MVVIHSTDRYPRALRFIGDNRLVNSFLKVLVSSRVQWAWMLSESPLIIPATRVSGSEQLPSPLLYCLDPRATVPEQLPRFLYMPTLVDT